MTIKPVPWRGYTRWASPEISTRCIGATFVSSRQIALQTMRTQGKRREMAQTHKSCERRAVRRTDPVSVSRSLLSTELDRGRGGGKN